MLEIFLQDIPLYLMGVLVFFLALAIHEIGHILGGLVVGFKFGSLKIGLLHWYKTNGRINFNFSKYLTGNIIVDIFTGQGLTFPGKGEYHKHNPFWLLSGGPFANLVVFGIFLTILNFSGLGVGLPVDGISAYEDKLGRFI